MFSHAPCQKSATREAFLQWGGFIWGSRVYRALLGKMDGSKGAKIVSGDHFMKCCWFSHPPALLRAIIPHSCAFTCSYSPNMKIRSVMGLQNQESVSRPARLPFNLPSWEQCSAKIGSSLIPLSSGPPWPGNQK